MTEAEVTREIERYVVWPGQATSYKVGQLAILRARERAQRELGERFDVLTEQLSIVTGLWNTPIDETFSFAGKHFQLTDSPALPKPVQSPPPIIIGGGGPKRTPMLAARFGAEFNLPFQGKEFFSQQCDRVRAACDSIGRDPQSLVYSNALIACIGKDEKEIARRAAVIGRDVDELRLNGLCGTPAEAVERLLEWKATGSQRVYLQMLDLDDLEHLVFFF